MKTIISKTVTMFALAAALLSFTSNFGGEGFEISINGKVVLERFGKNMDDIKTLKFHSPSANDKLTMRYYHCGTVGKNRVVSLKDGQNKLVKEWRFKDASTNDMSCNVKDLMSLQTGNNLVLKLYYSSSELPNGRQLATVFLEKNNAVAKQP